MSESNKVLYNIEQNKEPSQKATARKNIGAYEDKTTAGGGTGIPKADLASDVQSSLGKADSSVQSVTSNGQALTKSAAGAIDIPKATDTKWGVVQVVNELKDNQNVIPNSRVIKEAVDGLSAALQARATFWTVQEWQTQSAQPGDASKIYYVGPKGTGNDQYDMYEWRTSTRSYVLTDESTISLDGYWHGAPDIVGEDTVAPFITSIEKNADDTVKYRTCSATVGDLALPVFMDSGVVTPVDPHLMFPIVRLTTPYEEVDALVQAGYRPILLPYNDEYGERYQLTYTKFHYEPIGPEYIFTAIENERGYLPFFADKKIVGYSCQNIESETWIQLDDHLLPVIPEPNDSERDVGKVLTVSAQGRLYWAEPAGGNNVEVRAGTNNLHVTSADVNEQTIFTMSADYYHSSGSSNAYSDPGTVIIDSATMNIESTNSGFGYKETLVETSLTSTSDGQALWNQLNRGGYNSLNVSSPRYSFIRHAIIGELRDDCYVEFWADTSWSIKLNAEELRKEPLIAIPDDVNVVNISRGSEDLLGEGYARTGYHLYGYKHSDNSSFSKGELAWKDETYRYVDEKVSEKEPLLPRRELGSTDIGKVLTVSGRHGELGWTTPATYREGQYIHIDANGIITASGLQPKLATPNSECYLCGTENGGMWWYKRKKYMYISDLASHTLTQTDVQNKYCDLPINWDVPSEARIWNFMFCMGMDDMYMRRDSSTLPLDSRVKKIKCSIFNEGENTWYSNDNAHPNDPNGLIFNDILGSELSRVAGYWSLNAEVKRAGMSGNYSLALSGPSFRVVFNSDADIQVGDEVVMHGRISGIDFKDAGWGALL